MRADVVGEEKNYAYWRNISANYENSFCKGTWNGHKHFLALM